MIDRAIKVLNEAEKSLVTVINLFSELSQTIGTVESNTVKKKILTLSKRFRATVKYSNLRLKKM